MLLAVKALVSILAGCFCGGGGGSSRTAVPQPSQVDTAQPRHRPSLKDSIDGKVDLSKYITDANGFVPVPIIITEPAVGGFGGAIAPVFIKRRPSYLDSIKGGLLVTPVAPDVTGGIGAYTLNNSWVLAGFRSGTFVRLRLKYLIAAGYANLNLAFYKTFDRIGEKELQFNIETVPISLEVKRRIRYSHWYAGLNYSFLKTKVLFNGNDTLGDLVKSLETDKVVSEVGVLVELDNRDNIFTPDKGIKFLADAVRSDNIFGSDYDFWRLDSYMYGYLPLARNWTGGLRVAFSQVFGDPPFYLQPAINMRGIPLERYQGNAVTLSEAELRWDFVPRWSGVAFSGAGKAFEEWSGFGSADWIVSWGAGFRYLLAREFKLRVGIDIAHGAGTFAYYIIFGSSWLR